MTEPDDITEYCRMFIARHNITCLETIYQMDEVIEAAFEFIEGICDRVGYAGADND